MMVVGILDARLGEPLLALIEKAIGKSIYRGTAIDEPVEDVLAGEEVALAAAT